MIDITLILLCSQATRGLLLKPFSMQKPTSLADIARATGFALSTVSMALRGDVSIPPVTREKIAGKARELKYCPNPLLSALASRRFSAKQSSQIPLAYIRLPENSSENELVTQKIIEAQQEHARKLGYRLEPFKVTDFRDGEQASQLLYTRGFQGILLQTHFQLSMLPGMDWNRFSVVGWGEGVVATADSLKPMLSRATVDHFASVLRCWDEVWKRGYRKIGFALFETSQSAVEDRIRLGAALTCLQQTHQSLRIDPFILKTAHLDSQSLAQWVRLNEADAVIGFNGHVSWALETQGFRLPEDLGFASLHNEGDPRIVPYVKNRNSGMKEMRFISMLAAVELLDQQVRHHQYGLPREPRTIMINSEWIDGETLLPKASHH
jgi:LacI family transcriptional regulator